MRQQLNCSIFRAMEVLNDRWTMLVLREAFMGVRRFTDMQRDLGVARNVLTDRLNHLVDAGVLERRPYQDRPVRHEYRLTEMGKELHPVLLSLMQWGDRHLSHDGPPVVVEHRECGHDPQALMVCDCCREPLTTRNVKVKAGPGLPAAEPAPGSAAAA